MNELWFLQLLCLFSGSIALTLFLLDLLWMETYREKTKRRRKMKTQEDDTGDTQVLATKWEDIIWISTGKENG